MGNSASQKLLWELLVLEQLEQQCSVHRVTSLLFFQASLPLCNMQAHKIHSLKVDLVKNIAFKK